MKYHKGYGFKMLKMKLPTIRKKKKTEGYDYSDDIDWDNCKHKRTKIHSVKDEWEQDLVDIEVECKGCHRIGIAKARLDYEDEVTWSV